MEGEAEGMETGGEWELGNWRRAGGLGVEGLGSGRMGLAGGLRGAFFLLSPVDWEASLS